MWLRGIREEQIQLLNTRHIVFLHDITSEPNLRTVLGTTYDTQDKIILSRVAVPPFKNWPSRFHRDYVCLPILFLDKHE